MTSPVQQIVQTIDAQVDGDTSALVSGGEAVLARWGALIERYRGHVPASLAAVRIWHETRGNPDARVGSTGETGLLQVWPWLAQKYGIDPRVPEQNLWAGFDDWNARSRRLARHAKQFVPGPLRCWWGLTNCAMSVGEGATRRLVKHVRGNYSAVLRWMRSEPGAFLALPSGWWGSQSARLVAKRWAATERWLRAAESISPVVSVGYGRRVPKGGIDPVNPVVALLAIASVTAAVMA